MNLSREIKLGGFLSQCEHSEKHYDTFIVEKGYRCVRTSGSLETIMKNQRRFTYIME